MATRVGVAEFLEKLSKLKNKQEKVEALKFNDSFVLRVILQGCFDPKVKFLLPEGTPPYKVNDLVDQQNVLIRDIRKIQYFVEGFYPNLKQQKREMMFIEMLETVTPEDAVLLCAMKDKKIPYKGITYDIVKEAFPDLLPEKGE
jgi:hypothetical protein